MGDGEPVCLKSYSCRIRAGGHRVDCQRKGPGRKLGGDVILAAVPRQQCALVTDVCALQGVVPTAQRAAIVVGVELPVYDITKKHLILSGLMGDTIFAHFV